MFGCVKWPRRNDGGEMNEPWEPWGFVTFAHWPRFPQFYPCPRSPRISVANFLLTENFEDSYITSPSNLFQPSPWKYERICTCMCRDTHVGIRIFEKLSFYNEDNFLNYLQREFCVECLFSKILRNVWNESEMDAWLFSIRKLLVIDYLIKLVIFHIIFIKYSS